MRSLKAILSAVLCVSVLFLLAAGAAAEEPDQGWALEEGVLCITGRGEMDFARPFPWEDRKEEIQSLRVDDGITAIQAEALKDCTALSSVTLPKGLRYIHDSAFENCAALNWVTLPEGLVGIGEKAFSGCTGLTSVFVPGSVAWVGDNAFEQATIINCTAGTGVQDYITACGGKFHQIDSRKLRDGAGSWSGGTWQLSGGVLTVTGTGAVALPEGEHYYPWDEMRGDITDIILEDGITAVDAGAFTLCRKLSTVTFPESIEEINPDALDGAQQIMGYSDTAAETFAKERSIEFVALEPVGETEETKPQSDSKEPQTGTEEETTAPEEPAAATEIEESGKTRTQVPMLTVAQASAQPGQKVRLEITLTDNPGLCGLNFQIDYDQSRLTLEDFDCTSETFALGDWTVGIGEGEKALWLQPDETDKNGVVLTLDFRIAQDAPQGEIPVTLTEASGVNAQAELVAVGTSAGSVQVTVGIPGDVNGDGRITSADLLRLRRYLAGQNIPVETGNADLNADGKIDLMDLMLLQKLLLTTDEK